MERVGDVGDVEDVGDVGVCDKYRFANTPILPNDGLYNTGETPGTAKAETVERVDCVEWVRLDDVHNARFIDVRAYNRRPISLSFAHRLANVAVAATTTIV